MSLDNTTHLGRPGLDELVPSRYALRVGEIDVMVVSDGVLSLPGAMLAHNADPAVRAAWLNDMFLPPDVLEWALNVVVVRSGGRTILIDAGLGADPDLHLPRAGRLAQRLEAAGIDLASLTDVVLTHMHMDHIGGLLVDGVRDRLRPDLRIHLAAAEAEFWESPDFSRVSMPPGFPDALRRTGKRFLNEYHSKLQTFENEYEVAPGVLVQRTGGHTPGHSVIREFDYETVAPAVLGIKERLHGGRELRLSVIVHHARDGVEFSVADPDLDLRQRLGRRARRSTASISCSGF
jgi:hypothetical protein